MPAEEAQSYNGRVKWFNSRSGFGFITTIDGDEEDVFVHQSHVCPAKEQYRYLVEGEYVSFKIVNSDKGGDRARHAADVTGIQGGKLMCETRAESRARAASSKDAEPSTNSEGGGDGWTTATRRSGGNKRGGRHGGSRGGRRPAPQQ